MADIDNFNISWQGLTHGEVEDAIKAKAAQMDDAIEEAASQGGITQEEKDKLNDLPTAAALTQTLSGKADLIPGSSILNPTQWPKVVVRNITGVADGPQIGDDVIFSNGSFFLVGPNSTSSAVPLGPPREGTLYYCLFDAKYYYWMNGTWHEAVDSSAIRSISVNNGTPIPPNPRTGNVNISVQEGGGSVVTSYDSATGNLTLDSVEEATWNTIVRNNVNSVVAKLNELINALAGIAFSGSRVSQMSSLDWSTGGEVEPQPVASLTSPEIGASLNVGTNTGNGVSRSLYIKGENLTQALSIAVDGTGFSVSTQSVSAANANTGVNITVTYNGTDVFSSGSLTITSSEVSRTVSLSASSSSNDEQEVTTPTLNVSKSTLSVRAVSGGSATKVFNIVGNGLTNDVTIAVSGTDAAMFTLSHNLLTPLDGSVLQQITVTYSPTATGSHSATITISSNGASSKTVSLSGTATQYPVYYEDGTDPANDDIEDTTWQSGEVATSAYMPDRTFIGTSKTWLVGLELGDGAKTFVVNISQYAGRTISVESSINNTVRWALLKSLTNASNDAGSVDFATGEADRHEGAGSATIPSDAVYLYCTSAYKQNGATTVSYSKPIITIS